MIYDLIVVGNGLAAQTFLFELFTKLDVEKSKNFSVAQIYSEEIAQACSLRSTATVSLSGVEEGVSDLGNELRDSFFLFEDFQNKHKPHGVEKINQLVTYTTEKERAKMIRRYKSLSQIQSPFFKEAIEGFELDAFLIGPELLHSWFNQKLSEKNLIRNTNFVTKISKDQSGIIECELLNKEVMRAKKVILCTGAYAKLFSHFNVETDYLANTQNVPGSYLERSLKLSRPSFSITMDGFKLIYRNDEEKLILGSVSMSEDLVISDHQSLSKMLGLFNQKLNFSLGIYSDFKVVTGLRLKGPKRRPMAGAIDAEKNIYAINGLYKNGYTFSHLCAKKVLSEIIL